MTKWKTHSIKGNSTLSGDSYYISYNHGSDLFGKESEETALCINKDNDQLWLILNGDFRKVYEEIFDNGVDACINIYKANIEKRSVWSTDEGSVEDNLEIIRNVIEGVR